MGIYSNYFLPHEVQVIPAKSICSFSLFALSYNDVRLWVTFSSSKGLAVLPECCISDNRSSRKQNKGGCWILSVKIECVFNVSTDRRMFYFRGATAAGIFFRWYTGHVVLWECVFGPLPAAGASHRRWLQLCSSRWSRRTAAPSRYSALPAHMQPKRRTHTHTHTDGSLDMILHKETAMAKSVLLCQIMIPTICGSFQ